VTTRSPTLAHATIAFGSCWLLAASPGCTGKLLEPAGIGSGGSAASSAAGGSAAPGSGGSGAAGGAGSGGSAGSGVRPESCNQSAEPNPGPTPMRLLSREQYANTVRDLVGEVAELTSVFEDSEEPSSFGLVQPDISQVELERFQQAADLVAAAVVADKARLGALAPCVAGSKPRDCAKSFVESFGAHAYRAPLTDAADVERHLTLYDVGAATSHEHGIELVLRGILQAPRFVYRVEVGTGEKAGENAVKLSGFEVAARLSYAIWNTAPDSALIEAARSGALSTPQGVTRELERMLADARGASVVRRFLEGLVQLQDVANVVKDEELYPEWKNLDLRTSMRDQTRSFLDHVLQAEGGRLATLFTSRTVFVNQSLAPYYGVTATSAFAPFQLGEDRAAGILTLPALLTLMAKADESSPIYRGKFVREVLLCQQLPAPPAEIPRPPEVTPGVSTRDRLSEHEVNPDCSGCHRLMDPIGFGFEHYDAIGRYRTTDGGKAIDASGELFRTRDINGAFNGVSELAQRLASSAEVRECVARQWFRFVLSRFEQKGDECSLGDLLEGFGTVDANLNALPRAIVTTDAFLYRRPLTPQVSP
jgi:hypothetical protein